MADAEPQYRRVDRSPSTVAATMDDPHWDASGNHQIPEPPPPSRREDLDSYRSEVLKRFPRPGRTVVPRQRGVARARSRWWIVLPFVVAGAAVAVALWT